MSQNHANLIVQAQQLLANPLLQDLIQEQMSWKIDTLCRGDPTDLAALARANIAWQTLDDLRGYIREQAEKIIANDGER